MQFPHASSRAVEIAEVGRATPMSLAIRFQPIRLAGHCGGEDALLGLVNDHLMAVLVRVADDGLPADQQGWYLEAGFGPCRGEGLLFPVLTAGEAWIRQQVPADWPAGETTT